MSGNPRANHILLLCFVLSSSVFFLFSTFRPSNSFHSSASLAPIDRKFTLILKVLAYNRLPSLTRCLRAISSASYIPGDSVHLHIYLDHLPDSPSAPINQSHSILNFVDAFSWPHGEKVVHYRTRNAGLQAQWIEAWWPTSDNEFAFIIEDDIEVSPLYYSFVRTAISHYYYNRSNFSPSIYGLSLQRPRFVPGKHGGKIDLDSGARLLLYQLVGTWGQILFPRPWKEFRVWYDEHKAKNLKPYIEGMVTTGWYQKLGEKIWTPWFIKFIHSRGYFNIYTNFRKERALSVSHRDPGVNYGKTAGPDSQLLSEDPRDFDLMAMPPLRSLKWYDFCFREVVPGRIVRSSDELESLLHSFPNFQSVLLVTIFETPDSVTRNLLCQFEKLGIRNYLLLGHHSDTLRDLARRGHPVVDADMLSKEMNYHDMNVFAMAYVIKTCVQQGYSIWALNANMVLASSDTLEQIFRPASDLSIWKEAGVFFARGSSSSKQIWSDKLLRSVAAQKGEVSFAGVVLRLLQGEVKVERIDESKVGTLNAGEASSKKMMLWPADLNSSVVQKKLEELNMWNLDADNSCKAVVCHPA